MVYGADHFKYEGKEAPARLLQKLETAGIPIKWVSEDIRAKGLFDITTDRVPLISSPLRKFRPILIQLLVPSAKALYFDLVASIRNVQKPGKKSTRL